MAENSNQFDEHHVIAQGSGITHSNRAGDKNIEVPADRPGVVIFLHGVNDPGANYDHIELGLCEGFNERLSRSDLKPGKYGVAFSVAVKHTAKDADFDQWKETKYDPDTYLYQRTEIMGGPEKTHSMFIPFYWGYRAAPNEIQGGEKNPFTLRGQYQDIHGNRLSKHFAKGGGMFNNATTSIPAMFDPGWTDNPLNRIAGVMMSDYQYSGESPHRHYFVLAAKRLAMLVHEIRKVDPNETVSIMAHSQGTLITLLAQAFLAEANERCADCVIMVDTPYSLTEPLSAQLVQPSATPYTLRGKLNTLINIVQAVTASPNPAPPLDQLEPTNPLHGGRTGTGWTPTQATRLDKDGSTHVFTERDNRGKVYLYFCTDDTTVDLPNVQGIGTHGVPDMVEERWKNTTNWEFPQESSAQLKAMETLKVHRFYQRLWSKRPSDFHGKPRCVGKPPEHYDATLSGSDNMPELRLINAEAIVPPYTPNLYGDEGIKGDFTHAGRDKPDYVSRDNLLGNPNATSTSHSVAMPDVPKELYGDDRKIIDWFNSKSLDSEDHTDAVTVSSGGAFMYWRTETPNELRERLEKEDAKAWDKNSYHSAILRDSDNVRRVAAMDLAIGQARSLDDPDMRKLLIAIADWKIEIKSFNELRKSPCYKRLDPASKTLIEATARYYSSGIFPEALVPTKPPKMVDAETFRDREKRQ